jgi:PBP1b-binding outer membrane lipoprotein LpoB
MKKSILSLLIISTVLLSSCALDMLKNVRGNGFVTTEKRNLTSFNGVKSSMGLEVIIKEGNSNTINIEADENLHEFISTEVEDDILIIKSFQPISRATSKKIIIFNNQLNYIKTSSGSNLTSDSSIVNEEISVEATSGSHIDINVEATSTETRATSGAVIKIEGLTKNHASSATSGSNINAYLLKNKNTLVKASSGAEINIYASNKLEAKATSGGDIDYKGEPKKLTINSSSGGKINKKY